MTAPRVLAIGKAAGQMARAFVGAIPAIRGCFVLGPDSLTRDDVPPTGAEAWPADHPIPSDRNVEAAARLVAWLTECRAEAAGSSIDLVVLLSGGASAMLCAPREPLTPGDVGRMTDALLRSGASINELNAVRKHLEVLKGGGLLRAALRARGGDGAGDGTGENATRIVTLVLSDVLGDPLDVIGSGPTAPDPTTFADAISVLERHGLLESVPAATTLLRRGCAGEIPETIKPDDPECAHVVHHVIGNNILAVDAACAEADRLGYALSERRVMVEGEAADIGRDLARAAVQLCERERMSTPPTRPTRACLVWGGETTVTVGDAPGRGGRNQELALAAACELAGACSASGQPMESPGITIMSLATDGRDGPTDAAGAVVDRLTCARIRAAGLDPAEALRAHDSYSALNAAGALVRTGLTGTNVNDVMLALVQW